MHNAYAAWWWKLIGISEILNHAGSEECAEYPLRYAVNSRNERIEQQCPFPVGWWIKRRHNMTANGWLPTIGKEKSAISFLSLEHCWLGGIASLRIVILLVIVASFLFHLIGSLIQDEGMEHTTYSVGECRRWTRHANRYDCRGRYADLEILKVNETTHNYEAT